MVELQVSWEPGRVVAWAAGRNAPSASADELAAMLAASGAPPTGWTRHGAVPLPGGSKADAQAIPVGEVLGWLVAAGAGQVEGVGAERVLVGTGRDLGGRAHRARRDGSRSSANARGAAGVPATPTVRTRCAGLLRSSIRCGSHA